MHSEPTPTHGKERARHRRMIPRAAVFLAFLVLISGCARAPSPPAGTGAREVVHRYYQALLQKNWQAAHDLLDSESRTRCSVTQFGVRAQQYRHGLGLDPRDVHVRSCEEHADVAIARVTLSGRGGPRHGQYRDGLSLRREPAGWRVVLPRNFGAPAR